MFLVREPEHSLSLLAVILRASTRGLCPLLMTVGVTAHTFLPEGCPFVSDDIFSSSGGAKSERVSFGNASTAGPVTATRGETDSFCCCICNRCLFLGDVGDFKTGWFEQLPTVDDEQVVVLTESGWVTFVGMLLGGF